jgi:hypothetical protein
MLEFIRRLFDKSCKHKWSLPKQIVEGDKVFIGHRCKLCGEIERC